MKSLAGRRPAVVAAVLAGLLVLTGCRIAGGGEAPSAVPGHVAQFSFNLNCPNSGPPSGVLTYIDRAAGIAIRATPTACAGSLFEGTYVTFAPSPAGHGSFLIVLKPSQPQHPTSGAFEISLSGTGIPGGSYSNAGTVNGNVVVIG